MCTFAITMVRDTGLFPAYNDAPYLYCCDLRKSFIFGFQVAFEVYCQKLLQCPDYS
jgi:hypothetical protein